MSDPSQTSAAPGAAVPRTLHVRCGTWEQVHTFTTRKLRRGKLLSMKVPFPAEPHAPVTLGLELPNGMVIAIDGSVLRASPVEGDRDKTWIEVELTGFTDEVFARLREMAKDLQATPDPSAAPASAPARPRSASQGPEIEPAAVVVESLPNDERELFTHLTAELRRMRALPVHEVLGVSREAAPDELRRGWMEHVGRHHPDLFARRNAPAISHLAEELTILCNRAYDRMRAALVAEGRATSAGANVTPPPGWLVGFEDLASDTSSLAHGLRGTSGAVAETPPLAAGSAPNAQGGDAFESRARTMLGDGDAETAREVLAAALCVYPRSRPLRSLYYVASALGALQEGEVMLATSQLETALAHYDKCYEAEAMLEHVRKHGQADAAGLKKLFRA